MAQVLKPIYLVDSVGEYAVMPDGSIANIGGVAGPNFTVAGKPLLFADGTATDGSTVSNSAPDFQTVYQNSVGVAFVNFTSGKNLILQAVNGNQFIFNADTGLVTISGNLQVSGTTTTVVNSEVVSDKVWINQTDGTYVPFIIEPRPGVIPAQNLAQVSILNGQPPVFWIDQTGVTNIADLNVVGTINGIDLVAFQRQFLNFANINVPGIRFNASQIAVDTSALAPISGSTVQDAIASLAQAVNNVVSNEANESNVRGYEHVQSVSSMVWTVLHNANTKRVQINIWDSDDNMILPDTVSIVDTNTVTVSFNTAITGRAILMLF